MQPIRVSFDTNSYTPVANPQLHRIITRGWLPITRDRLQSKQKRIAWWYLQRCIKCRRIVAGIPEAAFAAEVLPNTDRVDLLAAIWEGRSAKPPQIPQGRLNLIRKAFLIGFKALHGGRIGYGELVNVAQKEWAPDEKFAAVDRQRRFSDFMRHFGNFPLESLRDFGEQLSAAHGLAAKNPGAAHPAAMNNVSVDRYLWVKGLVEERKSPRQHASIESFDVALRHRLADWADFDMVAAHYSYGYDFLCTEDRGNSRSDSIFGTRYAGDVTGIFGVRLVSLVELASICWKRFGFPIRKSR